MFVFKTSGSHKIQDAFSVSTYFRTLKNYGNKNIDTSLTHLNTCIVNNLKNGETYLTAINRLYENGEFKGQLKVQDAVDKIREILGQVDESTTLSYIYNPDTEQENLNIMNEALKNGKKKNVKK